MSQDVGIEVNRASVHTLSLSVQVMKLDKRQVTLAVFRQLDNEDLLNSDTGALAGTPWGRVNYHVDGCGGNNHLHLVWQKGERLFRANVPAAWPEKSAYVSAIAKTLRDSEQIGAKLWMLSNRPLELIAAKLGSEHDVRKAVEEEVLDYEVDGEAWELSLDITGVFTSCAWHIKWGGPDYIEQDRKGLNATELRFMLDNSLRQRLRLSIARDRKTELWNAAYAKLAAMDQLFIAT